MFNDINRVRGRRKPVIHPAHSGPCLDEESRKGGVQRDESCLKAFMISHENTLCLSDD